MLKPVWKIKHSENIQIGRFTIKKERVQLPTQDETDFSYIKFSHGVSVLAVTNEQKAILIRQYRHPVNDWEWELPAGMIDEGEEPLATAKRKLLEETGYESDEWASLGYFHPSAGSTSEVIHLFAAVNAKQTMTQNLDKTENIEIHPINWDDLISLIKSGEFKHGGGLAAILKYQISVNVI